MSDRPAKLAGWTEAVTLAVFVASVLAVWTVWVFARTALPSPVPVASVEYKAQIAKVSFVESDCPYDTDAFFSEDVSYRSA